MQVYSPSNELEALQLASQQLETRHLNLSVQHLPSSLSHRQNRMSSTNKRKAIESITIDDSSDEEPSPRKEGKGRVPGEDVDDDERFERDLQAAMGLSQKSFTSSSTVASRSGSTSAENVLGAGASRAEMERERRERQAARKAGGDSGAPTVRVGPAVKRAKVVTMGDLGEGGGAAPVPSASSSKAGFATLGSMGDAKKALRFWEGSVQVPVSRAQSEHRDQAAGELISCAGERLRDRRQPHVRRRPRPS